MARVKGLQQVTGSLKGVSMYTMRGSDEVIMRTKGGPSKHTIKTRESCKGLRDSGKEWGGCTKAASALRRGLEPLMRLADYNVMGGMNALCKKIQCLDMEHEKGTRNVYVRANNRYLADFSFNKINLFDRVIRLKPEWQIDRETTRAVVTLPEFIPADHLFAPNKLPLLRFVVVLGVCTDVTYDPQTQMYSHVNDLLLSYYKEITTEWAPVKRTQPAQTLVAQFESVAAHLTENDTLVLGIGVEFGTVGADGNGEAVKWAGCAKILGAL
jgi:hypothetical protein